MIRYVLAAVIAASPSLAQAQSHTQAATHGDHGVANEKRVATAPAEAGQSAFAAIQEIVAMLEADPDTDWSKVDIDGLRQHLVDMSNVTLYARAAAAPTENGVRFTVTGTGPVRESIRRMVGAHADTMSGTDGMTFAVEDHLEGAVMTVTVDSPAVLPKLEGLGFFGIMALGMHHQAHHLMIAAGRAPHH